MAHRIDTPGHIGNLFDDGGPGTGDGTQVDAEWLNSIQEEIILFLIDAGITPTKGVWTQLREALRILFVRADAGDQNVNGVKTLFDLLVHQGSGKMKQQLGAAQFSGTQLPLPDVSAPTVSTDTYQLVMTDNLFYDSGLGQWHGVENRGAGLLALRGGNQLLTLYKIDSADMITQGVGSGNAFDATDPIWKPVLCVTITGEVRMHLNTVPGVAQALATKDYVDTASAVRRAVFDDPSGNGTAANDWTPLPGVTEAFVTLVGAGGRGARGGIGNAGEGGGGGAQGGGAGATVLRRRVAVTPGVPIAVTVGRGAGQPGNSGNDGEATVFGVLFSANGGKFGAEGADAISGPGAGGTGDGEGGLGPHPSLDGDDGGSGANGDPSDGGDGGYGGAAFHGGRRANGGDGGILVGTVVAQDGADGAEPGDGGGGGGGAFEANLNPGFGGKGADGLAIIEW